MLLPCGDVVTTIRACFGWCYCQCRSLSSSSCFLVMFIVVSMGIDVNSTLTSYDMMHSSSSTFISLILSRKSLLLCTCWGDFPMRGLMIFASSLASTQQNQHDHQTHMLPFRVLPQEHLFQIQWEVL